MFLSGNLRLLLVQGGDEQHAPAMVNITVIVSTAANDIIVVLYYVIVIGAGR